MERCRMECVTSEYVVFSFLGGVVLHLRSCNRWDVIRTSKERTCAVQSGLRVMHTGKNRIAKAPSTNTIDLLCKSNGLVFPAHVITLNK